MDTLSDGWQTPADLFNVLNKEFNFDIDLTATKENSKCNDYYSDYLNDVFCHRVKDYVRNYSIKELSANTVDLTCFMNPPYSNPKLFIEKAWEDSRYCKIVCLVKCDPSTKWWSTFWDYEITFSGDFTGRQLYRGPKSGCEARFFPKRIKFDPPQELIDSGEVFKKFNCKYCDNGRLYPYLSCTCKGKFKWVKKFLNAKGYKALPGPTFSSALIIMDRR